jgi:hypothetical protein
MKLIIIPIVCAILSIGSVLTVDANTGDPIELVEIKTE